MSFHEENNNIYGHVAGVLTVSIMLPQLFHTWKIKSTRDLSMTMLIINQISGILWIIFFSTYVTFYNEYESSMRAEFSPPQPYKPYESSKSELREEKCKNEFNARYSNNNVSMSEMKKRQLWLDRCRYSEPY